MAAVRFRVLGMTCAACAARVENALRSVPGVASATVDPIRHVASIEAAEVDRRRLLAAVQAEGYVLVDDAPDVPRVEGGRSAALSVLVAVVAAAIDIGLLPAVPPPWISMVAGLVALPMVLRGLRALVALRPSMESLIAVAATASIASVAYGLGPHGGHDSGSSVAHMLAAVAVGRWIEGRLKARAAAAFERTAAAIPTTATLQDGRRIDARTLSPSQRFVVAVGERCATNAVVIDGEGAADESLLTGESVPVAKREGDTIFGGTVIVDGPLVVEATTLHADSRVVLMWRALEAAQASRSPGRRWSEAVLARFVPLVFLAAIVALAAHGIAGDWRGGLLAAIATLAVSCPCALGLAAPAALAAAFSSALRRGVLVRDAATLERMADLTTVAFDKTGTLTETGLRVARFDVRDGDPRSVLSRAAAVCAGSRHPAARALADHAVREGVPSVFAEGFLRVGRGGDGGRVDGARVEVGSAAFMAACGYDMPFADEGSAVLVAVDGAVVARAMLGEVVRPESPTAVARLAADGVDVAILSGDAPAAVRRVAEVLGIDDAHGGMTPEAKAAFVAARRARGERVAMVGDGLNDGAAFTAADVGIAVGAAADFAATSASVIVADGNPAKIVDVLELAEKTRRVIRRNFAFAVAYNAIAAPLAMAGLLSPAVCAAAMAASSLVVVAHAATLARR